MNEEMPEFDQLYWENQYDLCFQIASEAHKEQKRKVTGEPYINHCVRFADNFNHGMVKCAAILHDVLEDTGVNYNDLIHRGVNHDVVTICVLLDKTQYDSYGDYVTIIYRNHSARRVKFYDIFDNVTDHPSKAQKEKYKKALADMAGVSHSF